MSLTLSSQYKLSRRLIEYSVFFLLAVAVWFIFQKFAIYGFDPYHEGVMFKPALDVAEGKLLFKESFTQYGSIATYIHAAFINIIGPSILSIRLATVFLYSVNVFLMLALWRRFLPIHLTILSFLYWILITPFFNENPIGFLSWSSVAAITFQLLGVSFFAKSLLDRELKFGFLSGIAVGLLFHTRQPAALFFLFADFVGILLFAVICSVKLRRIGRSQKKLFLKTQFFFSLGFLVFNGLLLTYFHFTGSLKQWLYQNIFWVFLSAEGVQPSLLKVLVGMFPNYEVELPKFIFLASIGLARGVCGYFLKQINNIFIDIVFALFILISYGFFPEIYQINAVFQIPAFILLLLILLTTKVIQKKKNPIGDIYSILFLGLIISSWTQYYPSADTLHVYWALTPMIGFFLFSVYQCFSRSSLITITLFLLFLSPIRNIPSLYSNYPSLKYSQLEYASVKGLYIFEPIALSLKRIHEGLSTLVGPEMLKKPVINLTTHTFLGAMFESTKDCGPYYVYWGGLPLALNSSGCKKYMEKHKPIILSYIPFQGKEDVFNQVLVSHNYQMIGKVKFLESDLPYNAAEYITFWSNKDLSKK